MERSKALLPYLPQDRATAIVKGSSIPGRVLGSALFADISGFTSLTEFLRDSLGGKRGAEELSRRLDDTYAALIAQVERQGGSVIGFAGDAITCWFDARPSSKTEKARAVDAAGRALTCAFGLQEAMGLLGQPRQGESVLEIKVAIASGEASRMAAGDPRIRLHDQLGGATIARMAAGEHLAKSGEVIVDAASAALLDAQAAFGERRVDADTGEAFFLALELRALRTRANSRIAVSRLRAEPETLRPWIPESVFRREISGQGVFLAEFRPCVALFVNFAGIDYDAPEASAMLDILTRRLQDVAARRGGELLQITIGDKGSYAYFAFGAVEAHEDDSRRAIDAALEIRDLGEAEGLASHPRCGISRGTLFVGSYGGKTRRAFSALGDEVNIAARLMQSADEGKVLVTGRVRYAAGNAYEFDEGLSLMVKGKIEPIQAFVIAGEKRSRSIRLQEPVYALPIAGRVTELASIMDVLAKARKGKAQSIVISAEAGLGKSRLLAEAVKASRQQGFACYGGACQSDGSSTPYLPWKGIWKAIFDIDPEAPPKRRLRSLTATLSGLVEGSEASLGLLAPLVGMSLPEAESSKGLGSQGKKTALHNLLGDCLAAIGEEETVLIALEDFHWADELSLELLGDLARRVIDLPVVFIIACRPCAADSRQRHVFAALPNCLRIDLGELPQAECETAARAKWSQLFPTKPAIPEPLLGAIIDRAQGNPFFIEELLNYVRDRDVDVSTRSAMESLELPDSVHTLILSRIDRLTDRERVTIKVASVVGRLFRASWLPGYYPEIGDLGDVKRDLSVLEGIDITPLDSPEPELAYLFKHIMTHEVAYETLPYETRSSLHEKLAAYLESAFPEDPPLDAIAFHYGRSANLEKRREYLRKAGDAARRTYANEAALDYYGRLLPELADPLARGNLLLDRGDVLDTLGRVEEAEADFRVALGEAEKASLAAKENEETRARAAMLAAKSSHLVGAMQGLLGEKGSALEWLARSDKAFVALADPAGRSRVQNDIGLVFARTGEFALAVEKLESALALAREAGDKLSESAALNYLGNVAHARGDYAAGRGFFLESLEIKRSLGEVNKIANALNNLGVLVMDQGELTEARAFMEESLALRRKMGDKSGIATCLANLGVIRQKLGFLAEAKAMYKEAHVLFRELGDKVSQATVLSNLGGIANDLSDWPAAHAVLAESLSLQENIADPQSTVWALVGMARTAAGMGRFKRATLLAAAAESLRASIELALDPLSLEAYLTAIELSKNALSTAAYEKATTEGGRLGSAAAVALALEA